MTFDLYKDGVYVNGIESSLERVQKYCAEMGYTYVNVTKPRDDVDLSEIFRMEQRREKEKIAALSDRQDFIEDCIAEMAMQVYSE